MATPLHYAIEGHFAPFVRLTLSTLALAVAAMFMVATTRTASAFADPHSYLGRFINREYYADYSIAANRPSHVLALNLDPAAQSSRDAAWDALTRALDQDLLARVHRVERLTDTIVEVVVHAPAAARRFEPGQFYRLQNFEASARVVGDTRLTMEGLALTGAWVDKERGLLSLIILEMGGSSRLCAMLKPGEPVVVM